jgi:hypothetical protein
MCFHFASQYGNSRAVPNMPLTAAVGGLSPAGTFWFFAAIIIVGGFWVWFTIPETARRSLESMNRLFSLPWYKIGLQGNMFAVEQGKIVDEKKVAAENKDGVAQQIEKA